MSKKNVIECEEEDVFVLFREYSLYVHITTGE